MADKTEARAAGVQHGDPVRDQVLQKLLYDHLGVGSVKPISYLPIRTIEKHLGLSVDAYVRMAQESGKSAVVTAAEQSSILSGTVHLFDRASLQRILDKNEDALRTANSPVDAAGFVGAIARDWLPMDHPLIDVIREAFGDLNGVS